MKNNNHRGGYKPRKRFNILIRDTRPGGRKYAHYGLQQWEVDYICAHPSLELLKSW